ncbi:MAG: DUF4157 domain-containing protein, partial [Chloroflexota bacterium]
MSNARASAVSRPAPLANSPARPAAWRPSRPCYGSLRAIAPRPAAASPAQPAAKAVADHSFGLVRIHPAAPAASGTFGAPAIQARLAAGRPGDMYEQEADRAAQQALGISLRPLAPHPSPPAGQQGVGRFVHPLPDAGQPLSAAARAFFEPRFGHNFGQVRVHTGAPAAASAHAVGAVAYTVGRDVVFGAGQYQPGTDSGQQLLAHELAHVVQQGAAQPSVVAAPFIARPPLVSQRAPVQVQGGFFGDLWEG